MRDKRIWIVSVMGLMIFSLLVGPRPSQAEEKGITVELKLGSEIVDREVVQDKDVFSADVDKVYAWTRVKGSSEPIQVDHVWIYKGEEAANISLPVKSSSYRTWSSKRIAGRTGKWSVEIKDERGAVLASKTFTVNSTVNPATPE